jgi:hypothetical protein
VYEKRKLQKRRAGRQAQKNKNPHKSTHTNRKDTPLFSGANSSSNLRRKL